MLQEVMLEVLPILAYPQCKKSALIDQLVAFAAASETQHKATCEAVLKRVNCSGIRFAIGIARPGVKLSVARKADLISTFIEHDRSAPPTSCSSGDRHEVLVPVHKHPKRLWKKLARKLSKKMARKWVSGKILDALRWVVQHGEKKQSIRQIRAAVSARAGVPLGSGAARVFFDRQLQKRYLKLKPRKRQRKPQQLVAFASGRDGNPLREYHERQGMLTEDWLSLALR